MIKLNSQEYLMIDDYQEGDITIKSVSKSEVLKVQKEVKPQYLNFTNKFSSPDYVMGFEKENCFGYFIGEDLINPELRAYAGLNDKLYYIKEIYYDTEVNGKKLFDYIFKIAVARECSYIEIKITDTEKNFFKFCIDEVEMEELDGFLYKYANCCLKERKEGSLSLRHAYPGEEYDIAKDPLWIEEGETYLGYMESDNLKYTYNFDYIVGVDKDLKGYFGYCIGESMRISEDEETYNCYFIKDFYIYVEEDNKYEYARKLFEYVEELCRLRSCKYLMVKFNDDFRYQYFINYCKNDLGFIEKEEYYVKKI